jgi:hypothetical protein
MTGDVHKIIHSIHRWLGVDRIGIVENSENVSTELATALKLETESGVVELWAWGDARPSQNLAFGSCFERMRETHNWVAFIDADEYIMLLQRFAPSSKFLECSRS